MAVFLWATMSRSRIPRPTGRRCVAAYCGSGACVGYDSERDRFCSWKLGADPSPDIIPLFHCNGRGNYSLLCHQGKQGFAYFDAPPPGQEKDPEQVGQSVRWRPSDIFGSRTFRPERRDRHTVRLPQTYVGNGSTVSLPSIDRFLSYELVDTELFSPLERIQWFNSRAAVFLRLHFLFSR
jgi:hypothetical protein